MTLRDSHWLKMYRADAKTQQNGLCLWCRQPMRNHTTAEHLTPRSRGGGNGRDNIAAACEFCNKARGSIPKRRFMRIAKGNLPAPSLNIRLVQAHRRIETATDKACARILAMVSR